MSSTVGSRNMANGKVPDGSTSTWKNYKGGSKMSWSGILKTFGTWTSMYVGCGYNSRYNVGDNVHFRSGGYNGHTGEFVHSSCNGYKYGSDQSITCRPGISGQTRVIWVRFKRSSPTLGGVVKDWISGAVEVCYKISTGSARGNEGFVTVLLNRGSGFQIEIGSTMYSKGSTVYEKCFSDGTYLAVENTNVNAWAGTITANGNPMGCTNCDLGTSTSNIVVDGNTDGASQAPNRCLSGIRCFLSHNFVVAKDAVVAKYGHL